MARRSIDINGRRRSVDAPDDMPLLWVVRDIVGLTGTKYGCGVGVCGSCTVLENGAAVRSCQIEFGTTSGKSYTTIEGLSPSGTHPIQKAWIAEDVAQCGYCQPGMILELRALLARKANPSSAEIDGALSEHVCRCGSYPRIRKAALLAARTGGGR
jgi:aerobic-type carbon monoxide dehydrogenase small subunit (CoxS/CutS family)